VVEEIGSPEVRGRRGRTLRTIFVGPLYVVAVVLLLGSWTGTGIGAGEPAFVMAVIGLLVLCAAELYRTRSLDPYWLGNPCVLATFLIFGLNYGVSNAIYWLDRELYDRITDFNLFTKTTLLAAVGCFFMWRGYHLKIIANAVRLSTKARSSEMLFHSGFNVSLGWCAAIYIVSVLSRLVMIRLGIFGYTGEESARVEYLEYAQALGVLGSLGIAVLIALAMASFARKEAGGNSVPVYLLILAIEAAFGVLGGSKGAVVLPFVFVGVSYYLVQRDVSPTLIILSFMMLVLAYILVQPYRVARFTDPTFDSQNVVYLASGVVRFISLYGTYSENWLGGILLEILGRFQLTGVGSKGIAYMDEVGLTDEDPRFVWRLLISPLLAFIPRIAWPSKPEEEIGGWYTSVVLGLPDLFETSTAMGPVTYFYFLAFWPGVMAGFFVLGIVYRVVRERLLVPNSGGRLVVYVLILPVIVIIEAGSLHTMVVALLRLLPIFMAVQWLLIRESGPRSVWRTRASRGG
jgi:hypothetical protein